MFRNILQSIPVAVVLTAQEDKEVSLELNRFQVKELINTCREYISALRLEIERKLKAPTQVDRAAELSCYMTTCRLQTPHKVLVLKSAMTNTYKINNFITAAHFAKKIIDLESTGVLSVKLTPRYSKGKKTKLRLSENTIVHSNPRAQMRSS